MDAIHRRVATNPSAAIFSQSNFCAFYLAWTTFASQLTD
jgi:hypothetical protein